MKFQSFFVMPAIDRAIGGQRARSARTCSRFPPLAWSNQRVLLQMGERKRRRDDGRPELRSDTEDDMDELTLSYWIAFADPADLAFSDRMHRFVTLDGSLSALH